MTKRKKKTTSSSHFGENVNAGGTAVGARRDVEARTFGGRPDEPSNPNISILDGPLAARPEPPPETPFSDEAAVGSDHLETEDGEPPPERPGIESRVEERSTAHIPAAIQSKDGDESWEESVSISTVSRQGAGFSISRECPVGRVLIMAIEMPSEFRLYDLSEDVYQMLAVVQHCYPTTRAGDAVFNVGVAFIGKQIPESYKSDPGQCYRITGMNEDRLWQIVEASRKFRPRKHSRFARRLEVTISTRDKENRRTVKHKVFTRDVSIGGMSVWGPLAASVGDRVKISSGAHNFYAIALVRNRSDNTENETKTSVHFEFEGAEFPVQQLHPDSVPPEAVENKADDDGAAEEAALDTR